MPDDNIVLSFEINRYDSTYPKKIQQTTRHLQYRTVPVYKNHTMKAGEKEKV